MPAFSKFPPSHFIPLIASLFFLTGCSPEEADLSEPALKGRYTTYDEVLETLGDGLRENMVIRGVHDERTEFRAKRRFYSDLSDLADLPPYSPSRQVSGRLRISGYYLYNGTVGEQWKRSFERFQPDVEVIISKGGKLAGGEVDIETGPRISDRLRQATEYERTTGQKIFEIDWATGSYDVPGWSPAFVIFVHEDNPIAHLSIDQLDGIFSGARTGGWNGTQWRSDAARGVEENIRTWGQLGLTGEWADKPVNIYGRPLKYNIQLGFERKVFEGGSVWNENTLEYAHEMNPDGTRYASSVEMVKDLSADRYGIAFSDMGSAIAGVKAVPVGRTGDGPHIPLSLASLRDRSYPLYIEQWAHAKLAPGKPLDPVVKEFLTFMLSREGQDAIQRDGKWIPLPSEHARREIGKLEQTGEMVDPATLGLHLEMLLPEPWEAEAPDEAGVVDPGEPFYAVRWDLSDLPLYQPEVQIDGVIRLPESGSVMASSIGGAWMRAFREYHPGVKFQLTDGMLIDQEVDLTIGRKWTSFFGGEYLAYQLKHRRSPREVQIATGSFDVPGWNTALGVFVNADNPLPGLTVEELDGIFGGPRRGGWVSTTWRRQVGRGAEGNIRTWGQTGLRGDLKDQQINVYIPPLKYHIMSVFERKVLQGGNMWNDRAREFPLQLGSDGETNVPSSDRVKMVADDPAGITFSFPGFEVEGARMLPIARSADQPYVAASLDTVRNRSYPLFLEVFAYAEHAPGSEMDPRVKEFLRFVLSREGQEIVQQDGKWLPLTAELVARERSKLDEEVELVWSATQ